MDIERVELRLTCAQRERLREAQDEIDEVVEALDTVECDPDV